MLNAHYITSQLYLQAEEQYSPFYRLNSVEGEAK